MNYKQLFELNLRNYELQTIVWVKLEKLLLTKKLQLTGFNLPET